MIYDYKCLQCGNIQEEEHKMSEKPKIKCNVCNSQKMEKVIGAASVIFKGSGWQTNEVRNIVKTDYGADVDNSK
jgi:putative FmdB family regulatory protein